MSLESSSIVDLSSDEWNKLTLTVVDNQVLKSIEQLTQQQETQLNFLIESPEYWWLDSLEDCFNKRKVDDGILIYKQFQTSGETPAFLHYWHGYFGGNPIGYVLVDKSNQEWMVLIENCDTDFIWKGKDAIVPKAFLKQVKMAAYGDKYSEEDD